MIPQGVEVFVAAEPVDMRLGIERLSGLVRDLMQREPRSKSAIFVFVGKRRHSMKVLGWDGTGMVLWYKKLDAGLFQQPQPQDANEKTIVISEVEFEALFAGLATQVTSYH